MNKFNLKSKKGVALVYVLIVLMVFGILGVAVLTIASFSTTQSIANYNITQAGYSARSAVETTISYLSMNMNTQNLIPAVGQAATISALMTSTNISGSYKVKVERIDLYTARVSATAKVGNMTSSMAAKITLTLPGQKTANLENYAAYLKGPNTNITDTPIIIDQLKDANFPGSVLNYIPSSNININNLTSDDFYNFPNSATVRSDDIFSTWWNNSRVTLDLTAGGIYKKDGDIALNTDTIMLGNNDVFLFVNGSFSFEKYCTIQRTAGATGTFFLIFCGTGRTLSVDQGAKSLNFDTTTNSPLPNSKMANIFVYGPDVEITRKNKFYFKGAVIAYSYYDKGSQGTYTTGYLKNSAVINGVAKTNVSPWEVLFDKFEQFNIHIVPSTGGSVNSVTWDKNANEISLS